MSSEHVVVIWVLPDGATPDSREVEDFAVRIEWRGQGRYAVLHGVFILSRDKQWNISYQRPTGRGEQQWLEQHRFTLEEAKDAAHAVVNSVQVNGMPGTDSGTWDWWQRELAARRAARAASE